MTVIFSHIHGLFMNIVFVILVCMVVVKAFIETSHAAESDKNMI